MHWRLSACVLVLVGLSGCGPSYSPDTYASNAVQQANKVEQGVVVGVRPVDVSAAGTVGTISGAAAGGIAGSQVGVGPVSAITALGGSLVGGLAGSAAEHVSADTGAFEYIVRKPNGDLVSVTQKDRVPLALGQKVLVIAGNQARVVPDYTVPPDVSAAKADKPTGADKAAAAAAKPRFQPAAEVKPGDAQTVGVPSVSDQAPGAQPASTSSAGAPSADAQPANVPLGNAPARDAQQGSPAPANAPGQAGNAPQSPGGQPAAGSGLPPASQ